MATRTITGNIHDLTDTAVSSGVVTFEKVATSTTGNTIHQFGLTTDTTDGSGNFSIDLAVPASGSYRYRMILPNGEDFYFSIAAGASVNVATLIIAEVITDQDAIVEALAAYVPLSGGTMTGQLNFSGTTHRGIRLINLTTAQRDAVATPGEGALIWNTTTGTVQEYNGSAWADVGGGGAVSSVFGRTGAVVAVAADYAASEIEDDSEMAKASVAAALNTLDASVTDLQTTKQDADADLAAIAALTPSNDDVIQRKAGAWTNRTMAQVLDDLDALPEDAGIVTVSSGRDLATTDAGKILECSGTFSMTCPNGLDAGFQCTLVNVGSGTITIAAATTLQGDGTQLATQYTGATVYHRGSNVWLAMGRLT